MKNGWDIKSLNEVCQIRPPKNELQGHLSQEDHVSFVPMDSLGIEKKYFTSSGDKKLKEVYGSYTYFRDHDVLLAKITPCFENGKLGIAKDLTNGVGFGSSEYVVYRPKEILDSEYLYYFLSQDGFRKTGESQMTGAVGHKRIPKDFYEKYEIPIPPLPEQRQIVQILDKAFAAIDQAKANIEQNIQNAQELVESYKKELLEKYSIGNLVEFQSLVKLTRGHNPPKRDFIHEPKDGYVRFYQIRDGWSDDYVVYVPDSKKLHRVKEDEMLMVAYRHIGKVFRGVNGAFNVALCKISNLDTSILNNDYLFELIPSPFIKGELLKISERSLIPSMSVKELAKLKVPVPPIDKQEEVVNLFHRINEDSETLIKSYKRKLELIDELKKSLLQKAFSGELTSGYPEEFDQINLAAEPTETYSS